MVASLALVSWCVIALGGCATTIVLPEVDPTIAHATYLVDYGRHASLVLPRGDAEPDAYFEYNYGEFQWYAHNQSGVFNVLGTLFIPTTGTLGRRDVFLGSDDAALHVFDAEKIVRIDVDPDRLAALRAALALRYEKTPEPDRVFNPTFGLTFVPDERAYWLGHTCNHEMAGWLKALGCEIRGPVMWADFKVENRPITSDSGPNR